jgi:hypothetical protein
VPRGNGPPSTSTRPDFGVTRPSAQLPSVVLPEPDAQRHRVHGPLPAVLHHDVRQRQHRLVRRRRGVGVLARAQPRHGGQQLTRVGGLRGGEQLGRRSLFHEPSGAQHEHPVGDVRHHAHVVRDQQRRRALGLPDVPQQVEDLLLNGDVQRRRRLVRDDQLRSRGQCDRDHHALAQPTGKLVRILLQPRLGLRHPHACQQLHAPREVVLVPPSPGVVVADRLRELEADAQQGVQRRHRLLEHHPRALPAQVPQLFAVQLEHVPPGQLDRPRHRSRRGQQPQHGERGRALARAGFADHRHDLARLDRQRQPVDGRVTVPIGHPQVADVEYRLAHRRPFTANASRSPSPRKLIAHTTSTIAMPGGRISHHAPSNV